MTKEQVKDKKYKEIFDGSYSLTYVDTGDSFICHECNSDKEGLHMVHSIYFEHYTDLAPMCLECVQNHVEEYGVE